MKLLNKIFIFHSIITSLAGLILVIYPTLIPKSVNVEIAKNQYILCYFIAACEFSIAYLSFQATKIKDPKFLKIIILTFIIFHFSTGILEIYALVDGLINLKILINIVMRFGICLIFYFLGIKKLKFN